MVSFRAIACRQSHNFSGVMVKPPPASFGQGHLIGFAVALTTVALDKLARTYQLNPFGVFDFATHATIDLRNPVLSALV